ncbi:hypothetical protein V6N13_084720 [Hibiscus sabdariffa]
MITLKRIVGLWGKFEALGVNADHKRECEKVTILISANQVKKIEEVMELEAGDKSVEISVVEIWFSEVSAAEENRKLKAENVSNKEKHDFESTSESSSDQSCKEVEEDDQSCYGTEVEALKAMCAEKENNNGLNRELENSRGMINEEELMGGKSQGMYASVKMVNDNKAGNQKARET